MDDEWVGVDNEEENEDDEFTDKESWTGRDSLIFLIDCTENMFVKMENEDCCAFQLALKCAITVMKSKIISSEKDLVGVVLFGSDKNSEPDFKHVYVFQELQQPGASTILALEKLSRYSKEEFTMNFGHSNDFLLSDAFWVSTSLFSKCAFKLAIRRILLFTNNDNPHARNVQHQRLACQKARDLIENDIELELLHMNSTRKFNTDVFYKKVLALRNEDVVEDPSEKFDELLTRVRMKDHKKRTLSRFLFHLPGGVSFSVAFYNLVLPLKKTYPVKVAKDTNEPLQVITRTYLDTGEIVLPEEVQHYQEYGGRKAYFDKDEVTLIKQLLEPGFYLQRFEPVDVLQMKHHQKHSCFIFPDESLVKGSKKLFTAMLKRCLDRRVMPVGWLTPRKNSTPSLVALLPQKEEMDSSSIQTTPPGFHVIFIPFSEDCRNLNLNNTEVKASADIIDKAKQIIKKLQFHFNSADFENPVLQTHWRNIEALALDLDEPEVLYDSTVPKEDVIEERVGKLIAEFQIESGINDLSSAPKNKRKAAKSANSAGNKIIKVDLEEAKKELEDGLLEKMTLPELKKFIATYQLDIKITGKKKADLQQDIRTAVQL